MLSFKMLAGVIRQRKEEIKGKSKSQKDMFSILKQWLSCMKKINESPQKNLIYITMMYL